MNTFTCHGSENPIDFEDLDSVKFLNEGLIVNNNGQNNKVIVGEGVIFNNFRITLDSDNNEVHIGSKCQLTGHVVMKLTDNNVLLIGKETTVGGANFICGEGCTITIGKDCMIAWGIEMRTTDSHAIFDLDTGLRINHGKDIVIADHVWIGAHVIVLKGAVIPQNSIVSIRAVVASAFNEEGIILGGVPAKVIKSNVRWERPLLG